MGAGLLDLAGRDGSVLAGCGFLSIITGLLSAVESYDEATYSDSLEPSSWLDPMVPSRNCGEDLADPNYMHC